MTSCKPIGALVVHGVCRAVEFYIPRQSVDLGEPPPLGPPCRLVEGAGHQQHGTPDTAQCFRREFGPADTVLMQRSHKLTPVLRSMVGLVQAAQRERPGAVQVLEARSPVVAGAAGARAYQHKRSCGAGRRQFKHERDLGTVRKTHDVGLVEAQVLDEMSQIRADGLPHVD